MILKAKNSAEEAVLSTRLRAISRSGNTGCFYQITVLAELLEALFWCLNPCFWAWETIWVLRAKNTVAHSKDNIIIHSLFISIIESHKVD